jgi:uncharacterized membrane protein HdeD (DUF308 family)
MAETIEVEVTEVEIDTGLIQREAKMWWLFVIFGVIWALFGMALLAQREVAIDTLAFLFGITFIMAGVVELIMATQVSGWKWLWAGYGALSVIAGITMFAWPDETLYVIAVLLAFFLVFSGIFSIIASLAGEKYDFWWLGLVLGLLEFGLGAWALRGGNSPTDPGAISRELLLLINLAGIYALFRGFHDIFMGFSIRHLGKELEKA